MVPARIAQALAPWLFGLLLDRWAARYWSCRRCSAWRPCWRCACCGSNRQYPGPQTGLPIADDFEQNNRMEDKAGQATTIRDFV